MNCGIHYLSCCPALEVMTSCATVVGVSVQSTCCTCTGAGAGNLRGVCTLNLGCAGSKGWKHLTLLLLENWLHHMPHNWGHGNCILSCWPGEPATAAGAETQETQDPYACGSKETEEAVPWSSIHEVVIILPMLLCKVITHYLLWICQVLSCLCGFPIADHWK